MQEEKMAESTKRRAPAAERAILILDRIATGPGPLGVSELARDLDVPKSSVHGICETLAAAGVLQAGARGYSLSAHCLRWSSAYLSRSSMVTEFQHILSQDRRLSDYTVTLSTLEREEVVYLACRNADKPLGLTFQIGMRLPAVYSATGKAMLSHLPRAECRALLETRWHPPFTTHGVRNLEAFETEAETWRARGYALDEGEIREGMTCIGAPILDARGRPVAGIAISMTSAEARPEILPGLGAIMRDIAGALAQRTG